ncbi:GIY-YIG nuclease family protein [Paenarthrobacter sp. CM16]|uniref:GIY-YIG nuclease family protein n=1 Tax=Paenarthrobacter sp. CM16 TaxID=2738447 RepID=UPI001552903D|nr:GIY-YIG nuclease family protein [Paenarthrobacter sp. CM16]NQD89672.1 GIY-YIG nuclease family protein [Paenarthrobacter sp. CM16]
MVLGKQVRLFLVDGTPGGMLTAEIMNWTGHIMAAGRSDLPELLKRDEVKRTGVYLLLGDDPNDSYSNAIYIGEADEVGERLRIHSRSEDKGGKDFWNRAIILTSKDANLTKAHARYLESRFISIAKVAGRSFVTNGTAPVPLPLPEADVSDMEQFIEHARIVLPVLGVDALRAVPTLASLEPASKGSASESPVFEMTVSSEGILARAQETDNEFVVLAESTARSGWVGSTPGYSKLHEVLVSDGVLVPNGSNLAFSKDYVFKSPSAAAAVVAGRATNGRVTWKDPSTGLTYGQWQEHGVEDARSVESGVVSPSLIEQQSNLP